MSVIFTASPTQRISGGRCVGTGVGGWDVNVGKDVGTAVGFGVRTTMTIPEDIEDRVDVEAWTSTLMSATLAPLSAAAATKVDTKPPSLELSEDTRSDAKPPTKLCDTELTSLAFSPARYPRDSSMNWTLNWT